MIAGSFAFFAGLWALLNLGGDLLCALAHGVPAGDIFIDGAGINTEATARDTMPLLRQWRAGRVLAVSHFYHLPAIMARV